MKLADKKNVWFLFVSFLMLSFVSACSAGKGNIAENAQAKPAVKPSELKAADGKKDEPTGDLWEQAKIMLRLDNHRGFQKGEEDFNTLRAQNPDDPKITGWLAQLYVAWAEAVKNDIEMLKRKIEASKAAKEMKDERSFFALIDTRLAKLAYLKGRAKSLGEELLSKHPENYIGHRVMADYYRLMNERDLMNAELEKVKSLNPDSVGLIFIQGAVKAQFEKDYNGAIALYDQALQRDPQFIKALFFKGLALDALDKKAEAHEVMELIRKKAGNHPGVQAYYSMETYISNLSFEAKSGTDKSK